MMVGSQPEMYRPWRLFLLQLTLWGVGCVIILPRAEAFVPKTVTRRLEQRPPITTISSSSSQSSSSSLTTTLQNAVDPMALVDSSGKTSGCPFLDKSANVGTYDVPALFSETDQRPIILFDGNCNLCSAVVQLLLKYDSCKQDERGNLRFAALQSHVGELLCRRMNDNMRQQVLATTNGDDKEEEKYKTIVVCTPTNTYVRSGAALMIARNLGSLLKPLRWLSFVGYVVPTRLRDKVYNSVSKRRKEWFGSSTECLLFDERFDDRFVDDGILTGNFRDQFADPNAQLPPAGDAPPTSLFDGDEPPARGDNVKIVWPVGSTSNPSVTYLPSHPNGICLTGGTGTIATIDLPMRVVLRFDKTSIGLEDDGDIMYATVKPYEVAKEE